MPTPKKQKLLWGGRIFKIKTEIKQYYNDNIFTLKTRHH